MMSLSHLHLLLIILTSLWPSPHPVSWLGGWGFPMPSALPWVPGKGGCSEGLGSLQLVTWLIETEMDRWLVKIGLVAPSQRNLADLTTPGFPHPLFPLGTQGPPFLTPTLCPLRNLRLMGVVTKNPWGGGGESCDFFVQSSKRVKRAGSCMGLHGYNPDSTALSVLILTDHLLLQCSRNTAGWRQNPCSHGVFSF